MTKVIIRMNGKNVEGCFMENGKALAEQIERFVQIALYGENERTQYKMEIENA